MTAISELLVSHGRAAAISRCRDIDRLNPARGDSVVFRGKRGLELGEVLCSAIPELNDAASGEILRIASTSDRRLAEEVRDRGRALLEDLQTLVASQALPLQPLDADLTLDGQRADVNVLSWGPAPLTMLQQDLQTRHKIAVYFLDCSQASAACGSCKSGGCGDCGDGGCGSCGDGNCSRGPRTADELTKYFSRLREQMNSDHRLSLV